MARRADVVAAEHPRLPAGQDHEPGDGVGQQFVPGGGRRSRGCIRPCTTVRAAARPGVAGPSPSGSTNRTARPEPDPPLGLRLGGEPHRGRAPRSTTGRSDRRVRPARRRSAARTPPCSRRTGEPTRRPTAAVWVSLTASITTSTGPSTVSRVGVHGAGHHDRIPVVGPDVDGVARRAPADHHPVARGVQQRCDGRSDGARPDDCDEVLGDRHHRQGTDRNGPPLHCGSPRSAGHFPGSFRVAQSCRRFVAVHRRRSEGDAGRLGGPSA